MYTTSFAELDATFSAIESAMPPDFTSLEGTPAADILVDLDLRHLKELHHFALGKVLQDVMPHLSHIQDPASEETHADLATTYIAHKKFNGDPAGVTTIPSLGHTLLVTQYASEIKHLTQELVTDSRIRTIRAIQFEPFQRPYDGERYDMLHLAAKQSRESIDFQLYTFMWGGSRFVLENLLQQYQGDRNYDKDTDAYLEMAPDLRRVVNDPAFSAYVHKITGLDFNSFMVLSADRRSLLEGVDITGPQVAVPLDIPDVGDAVHYNTDMPHQKIDVGCPARIVKGAVKWAPNMMLSACEVVASNAPLPKSYWEY